MGGEWIKTKHSGWIRPTCPLIMRKSLSEQSKDFEGEKYPYSLWSQNKTTTNNGNPNHPYE